MFHIVEVFVKSLRRTRARRGWQVGSDTVARRSLDPHAPDAIPGRHGARPGDVESKIARERRDRRVNGRLDASRLEVITVPDGGRDPAGSVPALTFTRDENHYRLSAVWASGSQGWSVIDR